MVYCTDVLTLDAPKRTRDGYMAVRAKAARTGVYDYAGSEVDPENKHGLRDTPIVKVLRDDQTVFDNTSARSFIGKPITDDHPAEPVTSKNWKDLARGTVMGAMRDGDYLTFDLLLTDAEAIAKVDAGKRELSNGYSTDLQFGDFTAPDGTKCQARQTSIVGNHVALVDRGRAGSNCAIKDRFAACDALPIALQDGAKEAVAWLKKAIALHEKHMNGSAPTTGKEGEKSQMLMMEQMKNALAELGGGDAKSGETGMKMDVYPFHILEQENPMKTLTIDGLKVPNVSDEAEAAIVKLQADKAAAEQKAKDADAKTVADAATIVAKDAEISDLKAKLKDAEITPAKLADAAKEYADVQAKAKAVGVTVAADADTAAIKKAVVDAKMGDAAKDYSADHIAIAFDALTKDAKVEDAGNTVQPIGAPKIVGDSATNIEAARKRWLADKANAHRSSRAA